MGTIERNIGNLHDQDTGKLVGYRNPVTGKDESLDAAAVQALVSVDGNLANGQLLADSTPNVTLTDKTAGGIGTTLTQMGFVTIPGGKMGLRTRLEVAAIMEMNGNDGKTIQLRAGPASGTFATATQWGGASGLTTQKYQAVSCLLWSDNSRTAQRCSPVGAAGTFGNNVNPPIALAIDTAVDWNIYVGIQFGLANGAPENNATLRNFWVRVIG